MDDKLLEERIKWMKEDAPYFQSRIHEDCGDIITNMSDIIQELYKRVHNVVRVTSEEIKNGK